MSLQSGLLSHRYSIRMHVPSPHLCSSAMQALTTGVTERWGGGVKRMQGNQSVLQLHQEGGGGDLQGSGRIGLLEKVQPTVAETGKVTWCNDSKNKTSNLGHQEQEFLEPNNRQKNNRNWKIF